MRNNKKGIVYAISIDHARKIAEYYCLQGMNTVAIDSKTPIAERKRLVEDFKTGKVKVLVNVDVFSEGFDCPDVEFVQMARPTLSLSKYLQQVGRGLRRSDGKEACVLIDNVGLYRVFGLPTVEWDWDAMFNGEMSGRGIRPEQTQGENGIACLPVEAPFTDNELEVIISHNHLLASIEERKRMLPVAYQDVSKLKAWQDKESGLWGLCRGKKKVTAAKYITIFDCKYDMAAVRFQNKNCGVLSLSGETLWERPGCQSMKFMKNSFLLVKTSDEKELYVDLHSRMIYNKKPQIKRYGNIELLKMDNVYYSRTRTMYISSPYITPGNLFYRGFYLILFDTDGSLTSCHKNSKPYDKMCGYVCLLENDHDSYYRMCCWLADGSIVVKDKKGLYYHVERGEQKKYIGCDTSITDNSKLREKLVQLKKQVTENCISEQTQQKEQQLKLLDLFRCAVPFRVGTKWGLKVGERITIPPIYRNIRPPVGKYCAVEKNCCQWGVAAVDGTILIEPKYPNVAIGEQGTVTLTKVTGRKERVKLP